VIRATVRALALAASAMLAVACSQDPEQAAREYLANGDRLSNEGRDAAAVIEYRNAIRLTPSADAVYQRLGATLERLGRDEESQRAYEMAEQSADGRPLPYDEAALRAIVARHPRHVGARVALANRLIERGEAADAETHLRAAQDVSPERELINRALAALYLSGGRLREAEERLRAAAAASPQRHRSRLALADFFLEQQRWEDARVALDAAAREDELGAAVALRRAALADKDGAPAEARRDLAEILNARPTADAWALAAQFAYADGDLPRAEEAARRALTLNPQLAPVQSLMETIRWRQLQAAR
jgi:tetratricopeptide (TPR) repeat protein